MNILRPIFLTLFSAICIGTVSYNASAAHADGTSTVTIRTVGADSMASLMSCWTTQFSHKNSGVLVKYSPGLSADGAVAMIQKEAEMAPFAREYFPSETAEFQKAFNRQPTLIRVASGSFAKRGKTHALAIYVHPDNPVHSISIQQLQTIFTSDGQLTWGDFGLTGEWQTRRVKPHGMLNLRDTGNPPGIVNFMRHTLNGAEPLSDAITQMPGDAAVHALQQIVNAVGDDPGAIGYSGFLFANADSKIIPISGYSQSDAVSASVNSVASRDYPLSRYIYMSLSPQLEPSRRDASLAFLDFILSEAGQDCVANDSTGFYPLPGDVLEAEKVRLESVAELDNIESAEKYWTDQGRVRVVGYNDMDQILTAMNSLFSQRHPGINFKLVLKGTRTAPPALANGTSAFAPMGAEFSVSALKEYRQETGSDPIEIKVAHASLSPKALSGPLAFFVHADNQLEKISLSDARRIFNSVPDSEAIETWDQLGLVGDWENQPIETCGLNAATALGTLLQSRHFGGGEFANSLTGLKQSRDAVQFAANHRNALCFAAHNRGLEGFKSLAVSVTNEDVAYAATEENIMNGVYPLDRYLRIYVRNSPETGVDPLVREYIEMLLSIEGQAIVRASRRAYMPLSAAEIKVEIEKIAR